ncbi:MAG: hypothetical protein AUJ75_00870 [Candidatus Omnitrophica bacterium CG1_02_49_10]|nr:MAG: hypothetical protein AUJ75_00870 [Candidatus Omnitrophica bacterium CG1_02_49_10]
MKNVLRVIALLMVISFTYGCAVSFHAGRPSDAKKIGTLSSELENLRKLKTRELSELEKSKKELEKRLESELSEDKVRLEIAEKGLVITFVDKILFDSGKAELKGKGKDILQKTASTLRSSAKRMRIGIEGHTDNIPIKYSGFKSNWELSTARATSVLHYLIDSMGVPPDKLAATGYGEFQPIMSNSDEKGRAFNRRVEIVILPRYIKESERVLGLEEEEEDIK